MGKGSKRSQQPRLNPRLAELEQTTYLSPKVAIGNSISGEPKVVRISFENYDSSVCDIRNFSKVEAKEFINTLKKINQSTQDTIKNILRPQPRINNVKPYDVLFKGLPPDVDYLLEVGMTGAGRIFFHMVGNECYIVSTWTKKRT